MTLPLKDELDALDVEYDRALQAATDEQTIRKVYADYGGAEGAIRKRHKAALAAAPGPEKKEIGKLGNEILKRVEERFNTRLAGLADEARRADLLRHVDLSLPGRAPLRGNLHPITQARREIEAIFAELGFVVAHGPEVETDWHNFEALAIPADHPARDMQDTFYLEGRSNVVLRTHTSPVQVRTMLQQQPPVRIIAPGCVYRKDDDPTHSPMFNQVEGLVVDEGISFADLKGVLLHFVQRYFGPKMGVRLRPSYFPFVEPGAEVDMSCVFCAGTGINCRTCKQTGWIEIGGAGMVDPDVFAHVNYDSEKYTGFAFGMGIDRMAMLRYGIRDIKLMFEGDVRFARQFP